MDTYSRPWRWGILATIVTVLTITTVAAQQLGEIHLGQPTADPVEEAAPPPAVVVEDEEEDVIEAPPLETLTSSSVATGEETTFSSERPGVFREIHFRDASLRQVFQLLSSEGQKNIVPTKEVVGKVTADLYGVTFQEALDAVVKSCGYVYVVDGNFIYVMTPAQKKAADEIKQPPMTVGTFRLAYLSAADAKMLIAPALSKSGTVAVTAPVKTGISTSKTDAGGFAYAQDDALVVRDYPDNIAAVENILKELDVKPEQVLIEATILRATLTEDNALGIDFSALAGVDFRQMGFSTNDMTSLNNPSGSTRIDSNNTPAGGFRTNFTSAVPTGGISLGFVSNQVGVFLRALESITDTTVLANPKLLVVNKMRGEVMIGNRDGYKTTVVTQTAATESISFLETGTRLIVRPFIRPDGIIQMEIHPEDSSGSVKQIGESVLPSETTTEVTSNVMVRDGHTIVIGGLFRERTMTGRSQVPILGNVPLLGTIFRSTTDQVVREEVIILITPRIVRQEVHEATSAQIADDVERMRVGARKGLQWFGRGKLSQTSLRWAKEAIAQGKNDRALCYLDMALHLQPRMIEAIHIKERMKDQAYWAHESRPATARFVIQQMIMQDMDQPVERIVTPSRPLDIRKLDKAIQTELNLLPREWMPLEEQVRSVVKSCKQMKQEAGMVEEEIIVIEEDTYIVEPGDEPEDE